MMKKRKTETPAAGIVQDAETPAEKIVNDVLREIDPDRLAKDALAEATRPIPFGKSKKPTKDDQE